VSSNRGEDVELGVGTSEDELDIVIVELFSRSVAELRRKIEIT